MFVALSLALACPPACSGEFTGAPSDAGPSQDEGAETPDPDVGGPFQWSMAVPAARETRDIVADEGVFDSHVVWTGSRFAVLTEQLVPAEGGGNKRAGVLRFVSTEGVPSQGEIVVTEDHEGPLEDVRMTVTSGGGIVAFWTGDGRLFHRTVGPDGALGEATLVVGIATPALIRQISLDGSEFVLLVDMPETNGAGDLLPHRIRVAADATVVGSPQLLVDAAPVGGARWLWPETLLWASGDTLRSVTLSAAPAEGTPIYEGQGQLSLQAVGKWAAELAGVRDAESGAHLVDVASGQSLWSDAEGKRPLLIGHPEGAVGVLVDSGIKSGADPLPTHVEIQLVGPDGALVGPQVEINDRLPNSCIEDHHAAWGPGAEAFGVVWHEGCVSPRVVRFALVEIIN